MIFLLLDIFIIGAIFANSIYNNIINKTCSIIYLDNQAHNTINYKDLINIVNDTYYSTSEYDIFNITTSTGLLNIINDTYYTGYDIITDTYYEVYTSILDDYTTKEYEYYIS
jgi:hypothetical protein